MKNRELHILYGTFVVSALAFLLLMLTGCAEASVHEMNHDPYPDMPPELRRMQGSWVNANTNGSIESAAIIQGYTIRVRYQKDSESPKQKQNASIDRLDEERHLIVLNGGIGAWPYSLKPDAGKELLEIEFYGSGGWHRMNLCRAD